MQFSELEEKILKFWNEKKIFEKTLERKGKEFVFYDGPPFATGTPHYGHAAPLIMKDVVPRYWTMRGYHVARQWGWDCHGLPIENLIEQELHIKNKRDIEVMGIEKFNAACKAGVLRYVDVWKKFVPKIGRWADMDRPYTTMDTSYTESIWWAFKTLYDKGLIYEGKKSMHICPRCGTPLSNFEVTQGYKDVKDQSVVVRFPLVDDPSTSVLAWTTTPWTLPGNVGLAVKEDVEYVKVTIGDVQYIVAKDRASHIFPDGYVVALTMKGKELLGKKYVPLFPYFDIPTTMNRESGWQIVSDKGIDFVSLEEGTGIVHMAPAFGEDDMRMGEKHKLPFIQHVDENGRFADTVKDFVGLEVKPKGNPQETDKKIVAWLKDHGRIFSQGEITHSYPHCWRCETPLLNYATSSWFVKVTDVKEKMIANNKKIHWVPSHIQGGRFGKWLEGAKDWAISRRRYWGAPLPVWRCETGKVESPPPKADPPRAEKSKVQSNGCGKIFVAGSIADIPWPTKLKNRYWLARHGQCTHNVNDLIAPDEQEFASSKPLTELTKRGKEQIKEMGVVLKDQKIDVIVSSDLQRTKETAAGIAKGIHAPIEYEPLLREVRSGDRILKPIAEYADATTENRIMHGAAGGGESLTELRARMQKALAAIEAKYSGKNIVIVGHGDPLWILESSLHGIWGKDLDTAFYPKPGTVHRLYDIPLDLHRPTIDEVQILCDCGGTMRRVPDVFDCWFESGSMPYAQLHYPFENKKKFEENFPAQFIAEGLDQTRGWFYTLLVLSTALFGKPPFLNVIVNGLVLAEDGRKMSKRLKNYPDPELIIQKYGADAMRLYLLQSPVMRAEDLKFSEKGVAEVHGKVMTILANVLVFYKQYVNEKSKVESRKSKTHVLDRWILARLQGLISDVTKAMDAYDLVEATRPFMDFVNDLSTWYIRRSRERLKSKVKSPKSKESEDAEACLATIREVLLTLAKIMAPFTPFFAEHVYREVGGEQESVHLEEWPISPKVIKSESHKVILEQMDVVRKIVTLGHAAREAAALKVRQPLADCRFQIIDFRLYDDFGRLIIDELNVKNVEQVKTIEERKGWVVKKEGDLTVALDTRLTDDLRTEGIVREFIRGVNALRKQKNLTIHDMIVILYNSSDAIADIFEKHKETIMKGTIASQLKRSTLSDGSVILIGEEKIHINL